MDYQGSQCFGPECGTSCKELTSQISGYCGSRARISKYLEVFFVWPMVGRKERQIVSLTAYLSVRREIIDNRDKEIRLNLAEFVRGQKVREDLKTPGNQSTASTTNDAAATETSLDTADAQAATDELNPYEELTDAPNQELTRSSDDEIALHTAVDLVGLRSAYGDDASVKLVLDHLASRQRNQNVTEIETFVDVLNRAGTPLRDQLSFASSDPWTH
jgi:hypothetical protein